MKRLRLYFLSPLNYKLHGLALLVMLSFIALVVFSRSSEAHNLQGYLLLMSACYAGVFGSFIYFHQVGQNLSARYVFSWALVFHLLGIFGMPLFEDDYFRYLWDAYQSVQLGSPYGIAPSDYFYSSELNHKIPNNFQSILGQINYPDIPTIYGPSLQYSFLMAYLIAPGEVWALQLIYSAFDMLLIGILLQLAKPNLVMLYAWSPLVFKEIILTAHPDGFGMGLLMISIFCLHKQYFYGVAIFLAASVGAKIFALIFVPFLLIQCKPRHWLVFLMILASLYIPLLAKDHSDLIGLSAMAQNWEFNSALYGLLAQFISPSQAKLFLAILLCGFFAWYFFLFSQPRFSAHWPLYCVTKNHEPVRGDWLMGALLLCAPVINPWYLLWVLPFAVLHTNLSAWLASVMVMLAYVVGLNMTGDIILGPYDQPVWIRVLEFSVIFMSLLMERFYQYRKSKKQLLKTELNNGF